MKSDGGGKMNDFPSKSLPQNRKSKITDCGQLIEYRKGMVLHFIRLLSECAKMRQYLFEEEEIDDIFNPIYAALDKAKSLYLGGLEEFPLHGNEQALPFSHAVQQSMLDFADNSDRSAKPIMKTIRLAECPLCGREQSGKNATCEYCHARFKKRFFYRNRT